MVKKILTVALCAIMMVILCFNVLATDSFHDAYYVASIDFLPAGAMEGLDDAADDAGFACFEKLAAAKGVASPKTADMTKEAAVVVAIGTLSLACAALYVGKKSA